MWNTHVYGVNSDFFLWEKCLDFLNDKSLNVEKKKDDYECSQHTYFCTRLTEAFSGVIDRLCE